MNASSNRGQIASSTNAAVGNERSKEGIGPTSKGIRLSSTSPVSVADHQVT